ncbi:sigma-70 RNA polymerase sigma factor region 4 domain-containing protein [Treponema sp. R6D11]
MALGKLTDQQWEMSITRNLSTRYKMFYCFLLGKTDNLPLNMPPVPSKFETYEDFQKASWQWHDKRYEGVPECKDIIDATLKELTEDERRVVVMSKGFDGGDTKSVSAIAEQLNMDMEKIVEINWSAIKKCKKELIRTLSASSPFSKISKPDVVPQNDPQESIRGELLRMSSYSSDDYLEETPAIIEDEKLIKINKKS